jgi:hypothetical protein
MYSLGTWFVLGICVWIPYIKETMTIIIIIIIIIIITHCNTWPKYAVGFRRLTRF